MAYESKMVYEPKKEKSATNSYFSGALAFNGAGVSRIFLAVDKRHRLRQPG